MWSPIYFTTLSPNQMHRRTKRICLPRKLLKAFSRGALFVFCLTATPGLSDAQWKQSKFVLGTHWDPPFVLPHDRRNAKQDTESLLTARAAYFNLLTGKGDGAYWPFQDMSYRLEIADRTNLKSLATDALFSSARTYVYPFDQMKADALVTNYLMLSPNPTLASNPRRGLLGYSIIEEPCQDPYLFRCDLVLTETKDWLALFKKDRTTLRYVIFPGFLFGLSYSLVEDINQNGQFDLTGFYVTDKKGNLIHAREFDLDQDGHLDVFEDTNHNGILDPWEDIDGDGKLDLVDSEYYELYLDGYMNDSDSRKVLDVVAFDHYPFVKTGMVNDARKLFYTEIAPGTSIDGSYFYNLRVIRQKAGTRPLWAYPMSVGHSVFDEDKNLVSDSVDPDETHLRYMTFSPLAYGAKGLIYYTYSRPKAPDYPGYRTALVYDDGKPTPNYDVVQRINHYIRDIVGPVIMNSVHLGAFHAARTPAGQIIFEDELLNSSTPLIADVSNDNILIGLFRDAANYYALIVNKSLFSAPPLTLTLKGNWLNKMQLAPSVVFYTGVAPYESLPGYYELPTGTTIVSVPSLQGGEGRLLKLAASNAFTDLVGDKDFFHMGDSADGARQSPWLISTLKTIANARGYFPATDLDVAGINRSIGLTHVLPTNAVITSAKLRLKVKAEDILLDDYTILYDDSASQAPGQPYLPFIALRDLVRGGGPQFGQVVYAEVDLSRVPVRTRDPARGPNGEFLGGPDEYRNLLPLLADGEFNLIFVNYMTVDYSELEVTYANATSLITFNALKPTAPPSRTDATGCPLKLDTTAASPVPFAGKYSFDALLTNRSGSTLSNLRVGINELNNDNLLVLSDQKFVIADDAERMEPSEWFEVPVRDGYADRQLQSGESVKLTFTVCMKEWKPFRLFVDVAGVAQ